MEKTYAESDRDDTEYLEAMQGIITNFEDSFCPSCSWGLDKHTIVNFNGMPFAYCEMGDALRAIGAKTALGVLSYTAL
jgi:hypothetical protein